MEIESFVEDFDYYRKLHFRTPFVEQLFAVHLLVEHLLMVASITLEKI